MADTRTLHVSSTYAKYRYLDVSAELERISKNIVNKIKGQYMKGGKKKYFDKYGANEDNAKQLQEFFQELKMMSKKRNSDLKPNLQATAAQEVISSVLISYRSYNNMGAGGGAKRRVFNIRNKDGRTQGTAFEKELASIISVVNLQAQGRQGKEFKTQFEQGASSTQWGAKQVNFKNIVKNKAKGTISEINEKVSQVICNTGSELGKYVTSSVTGKIDVSGLGLKWTISASANINLQKIANLLSQASFTAKSYSSFTFNKTVGRRQTSPRTSLSLDQTKDLRRFFYTVLMAQGIPVKVAESMYQHINKTSNNEERKNAQRLRILYELTGYGQNYVDNMINSQLKNQLGGAYANYIIFNDPATDNIYVKTTAEVWERMEKEYLEKSLTTEMSIPKDWFTQLDK